MKNYLKKYILFILFLTHSLASWAYIQSPVNGSFVNGVIQVTSDRGSSAEIEFYGKNGWEFIGRSHSSFDTRSLVNGSYSIRDCYSYVSTDTVCVDDRVWVPDMVWVPDYVWVSDYVEYCEDEWVSDWVWVEDYQCSEYDENGDCIDYEDNGYWDDQGYYATSCSYVDEGYWEDDGYWEDRGYWDTQRTCYHDDKTKWVCDPYININVDNKPPNSLSVTCPTNNKTNSAGKVESVKCTASIQGTVSNINWMARVGTTGDFAQLNTCTLNADRTLIECANVPAGTYQVKAVGDSSAGRVESSVATIQATTVSISCTPKNAKIDTKKEKGVDVTCTASAQGTPVDGAIVTSGYWTASYVDSKTKQVVTVPKFCENLYICKVPKVPVGSYDVQARAIDKYGAEILSNLEKVIVTPK